MTTSIDVKDRKLILALYKDGRATTSRLAKQIGTSQEVALYRLNRLRKGILKQVVPIIDYSLLGYNTYRIQLKFAPMPAEEKAAFLEEIKAIPQLSWLVLTSGSWDAVLLLNIKDNLEFVKIYNMMKDKYGSKLQSQLMTIVNKITHLPPTYLLPQERESIVTSINQKSHDLDENQKQILLCLFEDGRKSLVDMGKELKLSITTIRYHLDILEKKRILLGFKPVIDISLLGYEHFKVVLELEDPSKRINLASQLKMNHNVVYITESLGKYDLEFEAEYQHTSELLEYIESIRSTISIKSFEIIFNNKEEVVNRI